MKLTSRGRFQRAGMLRTSLAEGSISKDKKRTIEELDKKIQEYVYGIKSDVKEYIFGREVK